MTNDGAPSSTYAGRERRCGLPAARGPLLRPSGHRSRSGCWGIAISGLPASLAEFNTTYAPAEASAGGYPGYASAAGQHLCYAPSYDQWVLDSKRFDPADNTCVAGIGAAGGPVPTGARAWGVNDGEGFVEHEVTAREVA